MLLDILRKGAKICLTEPRRAGADQIASRIAEDFGEQLGQSVGVSTRFHKIGRPGRCPIMVKTEGCLLGELAKLGGDVHRLPYDVIIFDEVHENNWWLSTLMLAIRENLKKPGNLHKFMQKERKIICMSATPCVSRLIQLWHPFSHELISSESRKMYSDVEEVYEPNIVINAARLKKMKPVELACMSMNVLCQKILFKLIDSKGHFDPQKLGDVLVFLPGQPEILAAMKLLVGSQGMRSHRTRRGKEESMLPGYMKHIVIPCPFHSLTPRRVKEELLQYGPEKKVRVILATSVAETALTFVNISHVVDSGVTKVLQYNRHNCTEKLMPTVISQSIMMHRLGRLGRTRPGSYYAAFSESVRDGMVESLQPELYIGEVTQPVLYFLECGLQPSALVGKLQENDADNEVQDNLMHKEHYNHAVHQLKHLGTIELQNEFLAMTEYGQKMSRLGDPKMAWLLAHASANDIVEDAALVAAIVSYQPTDLIEAPTVKNIHEYEDIKQETENLLMGEGDDGNLLNFMDFCRRTFLMDAEEQAELYHNNRINMNVMNNISFQFSFLHSFVSRSGRHRYIPPHNRSTTSTTNTFYNSSYSSRRNSNNMLQLHSSGASVHRDPFDFRHISDKKERLSRLLLFAWAKHFSGRYSSGDQKTPWKYKGMPLVPGIEVSDQNLLPTNHTPPHADYVVSDKWFSNGEGAARLGWTVPVQLDWLQELGLNKNVNAKELLSGRFDKWKLQEMERAKQRQRIGKNDESQR